MRILIAVAAAALSAALFYFGTGLHPMAWVTWLAPLPVLLLAPRVGAGTALAAGFFAWAGGQAAMWPYFLNVIEIPLPIVAISQLAPALVFGLFVSAFRALIVRGRMLSAALVVPAGWAVTEYVFSLAMPHGAWWSLAYTQADVLPVLQSASATGVWGITFLLMAVPSAVAVLVRPAELDVPARRLPSGRARVVLVVGAVVLVALAYGGWQLRAAPAPQRDEVALVATDNPNDHIALTTSRGRDLVDRYATRVEQLAQGGARVVVLPEKTFLADEKTLPILAEPLTRITRAHHVDVVVGLVMGRGGAHYNVALDFPAGGGTPVEYAKQHLIPVLEDWLSPGEDLAFVPGTPGARWGLIVCKDLDYPDLIRSYKAAGATALYAPAWDFNDDGWLHSRMAVVRGVENGLTIARAARAGRLVVSDPNGRIVAEATTTDAEFVSVTAALRAPAGATLYSRFGDWFAWVCIALLVSVLGGLLLVRKRPAADADAPPIGRSAGHRVVQK